MSLDTFKYASFMSSMSNHSSKLWIPEEFGKEYGEHMGEEALLMSDDKYGTCWKVKIKAFEGCFCFANGWPEFVKDNELTPSELVIFTMIDGSTFQVSFFGNDGVNKKSPSSPPCPCCTPGENFGVPTHGVDRAKWKADRAERKAAPGRNKNYFEVDDTSFSVTLTQIHKNFLCIPSAFSKKTGIIDQDHITLINEDGKSKKVRVYVARPNRKYVCLRGGWTDYWNENKLSVGNEVTFRIIGNDFGKLHVSREGLIAPSMPRNRRGRPRLYA